MALRPMFCMALNILNISIEQLQGVGGPYLDLGRVPYALYGVKYIDLVSLAANKPVPHTLTKIMRSMSCMALNILT